MVRPPLSAIDNGCRACAGCSASRDSSGRHQSIFLEQSPGPYSLLQVESALQEVAHIRRDVQVNRMQWLSSASQLQRQAQVAACLDQLQQRNDDMAVLLRGLAQKVQVGGGAGDGCCDTAALAPWWCTQEQALHTQLWLRYRTG